MSIFRSLRAMTCRTMLRPCWRSMVSCKHLRGMARVAGWPTPRKVPPPDLCYAVVVKERKRGHVVNVTTRIVYGSQEQIQRALHDSPVSTTMNTSGVERNNLTVRQHSRRLGRKVNAFSKDRDYLAHQ